MSDLLERVRQALAGIYQVERELYALVDDRDAAFRTAQSCLEERSEDLLGIAIDDRLVHLHGDPRFASLLHRLGLEDAYRRRWGKSA